MSHLYVVNNNEYQPRGILAGSRLTSGFDWLSCCLVLIINKTELILIALLVVSDIHCTL